MYLRLALISVGESPAAQLKFLQERFVVQAEREDGDDVNIQNKGFDGATASFIYRGSTAAERAEALLDAMTHLEEAIAGAVSSSSPGVLTPVFHSDYIAR
jgi:hypothetical protein